MKPIQIYGTVILSVMAVGALKMGFDQLASDDAPRFQLNGPAGTFLLVPALLAITARFWHRVSPISWAENADATLTFSEPWLNYVSTISLGVCLVGFAGLGFNGYRGKSVELFFDTLLLLAGLALLAHKLRKGRSELVLSPVGLTLRRAPHVAWDRVVGARMNRLPWSTEIVIDIRQRSNAGRAPAKGAKIKLLPILLGADPTDLLRAIEVRRTTYTF